MKKILILIAVILIIIAAFAGKFILSSSSSTISNEGKPLYWIDTMEPTVHYPSPGKSRMGMELVPVYPDTKENHSDVRISPSVINNLGVRTAPVTQGDMTKQIETVGYVQPNENKISRIHSYADGWIKKLLVNSVGQSVKKDQVLLQLYSPMLIAAQGEYLIALNSNDPSLVDGAINKLRSLNISEHQIQQLKDTKTENQLIDIVAPQDGVVTDLNVREGSRITPDVEIMTLVDLSTVWLIAQIFEGQISWVKTGETAEAKISAFPDKVWNGSVEYIYPEVDPTTRTIKVRFLFDNTDGVLKPNMYANITLLTMPKENVLSIPLEALIRSSQGSRVIVYTGNGAFQVRPVTIGIESNDRVEILVGLDKGELVVTSGEFLIDSEANLKTSLQRIDSSDQSISEQNTDTWSNIIIQGIGIVTDLDISKHSITLQHEPIPILSWPAMNMEFAVNNDIDLNKFKIGDHVQFTFKKNNTNEYLITDIKKVSS